MEKIENLTNGELLDLFDDAIRCDHYCPNCECNRQYTKDDLRDEIIKRMSNNYCQNDEPDLNNFS